MPSFSGISKFYDNRQCVVTVSLDDFEGNTSAWQSCLSMLTQKRLFYTIGAITNYTDWSYAQYWLDQGYAEIASHSRTHVSLPYADLADYESAEIASRTAELTCGFPMLIYPPDYESQINGSKRDIIGNLTLPAFWRNGNQQYVYAWIEPFGQCDETTRQYLGASGYLCDRSITTNGVMNYSFDSWDESNGLFYPSSYSVEIGKPSWGVGGSSVQYLNNEFDNAYKDGGIYHLMAHPGDVDWSSGEYADAHTTYISNRTDVWYVPFGLLYLYHWMDVKSIPQVTGLTSGNDQKFVISINDTDHANYGASYPLTYVFDIPSDWATTNAYYRFSQSDPWLPIANENSTDFFNGVTASRFDLTLHKDYVSIPFGNSSDNIFLKILHWPMPQFNVTPSQLLVERGRIASYSWSVALKNSGSSILHSPSISIVDSRVQITPARVNLTDISGQETASADFSVAAPSVIQLGSENVTLEADYIDSSGSPQTETWEAPIRVTNLGANINFSANPSVVKKGGTIMLSALLFDDNANPIPGQLISFVAENSFGGYSLTDFVGNASLLYTATRCWNTCLNGGI